MKECCVSGQRGFLHGEGLKTAVRGHAPHVRTKRAGHRDRLPVHVVCRGSFGCRACGSRRRTRPGHRPRVREAVTACLAKQPTSLHLDLADVTFCDCAGLSALLMARSTVLRAGVGLVVEGVGTQLARLLFLIGVDGILTGRDTTADAEPARVLPGRVTGHGDAEAATATAQQLRDLLA
ncbi:STAS domain-containing protein [Streptomyces sp. RKAG290]|uniref:STAS domain-containing protein n=1 Tax=Streptomyces sp. RKAG290 TaxID=2888348 RepID=UPI0035A86AD3